MGSGSPGGSPGHRDSQEERTTLFSEPHPQAQDWPFPGGAGLAEWNKQAEEQFFVSLEYEPDADCEDDMVSEPEETDMLGQHMLEWYIHKVQELRGEDRPCLPSRRAR